MLDEVIFIRSVFTNNITFYTQVFLEECSNKLTKQILYKSYIIIEFMFLRILMLNTSKKCIICH